MARFHHPDKPKKKIVLGKTAFHKQSFRNVLVSTNPKVILLVGCPKKTHAKGMDRDYGTMWVETPAAVKSKTQCRYKTGPLKGKRAGMKTHVIITNAKRAKR